jgi:hypothetical protein
MGRAKAVQMVHRLGKRCELASPRDHVDGCVAGGRSENVVPAIR